MKSQLKAIQAELLKNKYSRIFWVTFIAFGLAPLMGAVFMLILQNPAAMENAGGLAAKAEAMHFTNDWNSYLGLLTQALGVGGVLIFGFVASWIFGREYSDSTAKDLMALPTSRIKIINAKFIIYILWCFALAISNQLLGLLIGNILQLHDLNSALYFSHLYNYFITALLTLIIGTPIAFFAIWGKGYLAPLGFVALTLVFAQVIAAAGFGTYFPWAIPGLFSGSGGDYKEDLNVTSYIILVCTGIAGYFTTCLYFKHADYSK